MARLTQTATRRPDREPVRGLTVLYDPACRLCAFVRDWLARQRRLVRLDLVPVGSPEARRRFPDLDHAATEREITVVGDAGQVYRGDAAWLVCLWALAEYRPLSHTLATPAGCRLARAAVLTAAKYREATRGPGRGRGPAGAPGRLPAGAGNGGRPPYRVAPGWTYDPRSGWTQSAADVCTDGCAPPDRAGSGRP